MRRLIAASFALSLLATTPGAQVYAAPAATPVSASATTRAAPDDVDFLFRLGMLEGHLIIGRDLIAAKRFALAIPHFGHPVRELYEDVSDYIAAKHVTPFDNQLIKLEAAVVADPTGAATEALYQQTIASIHTARAATPAALHSSVPEMIRICSDTIDAAAGEYGESLDRGQVTTLVEYHDSRGFISYVAQELADLQRTHPAALDQDTLGKFQSVLARAQWIVDPLMPAPQPRASVGQYRSVAADAASLVAR